MSLGSGALEDDAGACGVLTDAERATAAPSAAMTAILNLDMRISPPAIGSSIDCKLCATQYRRAWIVPREECLTRINLVRGESSERRERRLLAGQELLISWRTTCTERLDRWRRRLAGGFTLRWARRIRQRDAGATAPPRSSTNRLSLRASILPWLRRASRASRSTPAVSHSLLALLFLFVELFLFLVVEQVADLLARVLLDLLHFGTHGFPVAARVVHQVLHLLLLGFENRLDLCLLIGRQFEIFCHLFQALIRRHRPSAAALSHLPSGPSLYSLPLRGNSAAGYKRHGKQKRQQPSTSTFGNHFRIPPLE